MPNLLLDEQPLVIQPTLAKILGLNEAIIVQQVHYWLEINRKTNKNFYLGRYWTYNSTNEWQKVFNFWSIDTVKRTFKNLENLKVLLSDNFNTDKRDRTKWYSINYEKIDELAQCIDAECNNADINSAQCIDANCPNGKMHSALISLVQNAPTITIDYTETTADINTIPPISPKGEDKSVNSENGLSGESLMVKTATETKLLDDNVSPEPTPSKTLKKRKKAELTEKQMETFEQFWAVWPYKVSRGQAEITWGKINPDINLLAAILAGVEKSKKFDKRFRQGSIYIPHPSSWLNDKGWLDEFNTKDVASKNDLIQQTKKNKFNNYTRHNERDFEYIRELELIHNEREIALDEAKTETEKEAIKKKYNVVYEKIKQIYGK